MPETTTHRDPVATHPPSFPVVGVGASAGGLSALLGLLDHLPPDCGFALVVVLHLPTKDAESALPILERGTSMPVLKLTSPAELQPNHLYLVPGRHETFADGPELRVSPAIHPGSETSIDRFFRALADAYQSRTIGVVLSGTGSDGAVGLAYIREKGGVTIAQAPEDADHAAMPRAAIASGAVDLTLPVNDIPGCLARLRENARRMQSQSAPVAEGPEGPAGAIPFTAMTAPSDEQAISEIVELLRSRTRHDVSHYKRATVLRRLERRLQVTGLPDLPAYRDYLRDHVGETTPLLQDLLISVTSFFRDPAAMASLEHNVLPQLLQGRRADDPIRVWVVGCATGEEAYSVGILLLELLAGASQPAIQVFATDIDERAIAVARSGLYSGAIASDVTPSRLRTFFNPEEDGFRVGKSLRESVLFASHNILHDPPFSRLDLVLCRNLLIYLDREVQSIILETFRTILKPRGYLFLGTAETTDAMPGAFKPIDARNRIYVVDSHPVGQPALRRLPPVANGPGAATGTAGAVPGPGATAPPAHARNGLERLHQRLLIESAPASVLVDAELDILHTTPGAAEFMIHPAGAPSSSLMVNVHPDLRLELRAALLSASETSKPVRVRRIPVTWQRGSLQEQGGVDIGVCPTRDPDSGASLSVILFEAVAPPPARTVGTDPEAAFDLPDLATTNQRLQDQLHQTITRLDSSTEALQAANAELASLKDALGRATEDQAAKREELQSMNEELIAVSQELKAKVDETGQISDDFQNLSTSGSIVALFLDRGMKVKRFTAAAAGLFGLGAGDPSRDLEDIADQLNHASLSADAAEALRTLQPVERLVQSNDGRFFLARIQPYRTTRDSIEGAVLNLSDATLLQQAKQELLEAREVLRLAADSSGLYALLVLDAEGRITRWNAGAKRVFGYEEGEIVGQSFETLADVEERGRGIPQETLRSARDRGSVNGERCYRRKDGSTFRGSYVATALYGDPGRGFVEAIHDLSAVQEARGDRDQLLARERALTLKLNLARRAQDELFDMLASELKRPLSLVQVNADMLVRLPETRGIPVAGKVAESISKAVVNQSHIIDGLRDLSLARSGKLTLQIRSAGLRDLIEGVVNSKKEQAASKSLSLEFVSDGAPLPAVCDPARIQQIARSLISNAIKFTEHGGVMVRTTREGEHARFSVSDTGVGIAPDLLETVFEAYELPATASPRPKRGLGIGLALVKELVSAHDGRIVAESEGTERGSTFTVWLRLAEPLRDAPSPAQAGPATADEDNPLRSLRVVLVDDSVDLLTSFGALLTLEGACVDCFDTAEAALARLLRGDVDLLISDLGMPGMNGYELISEVRKQPQLAALPAIALTGYGRTRDPGHAVRSGFNAHTTKPATVEELKNIVALLKSL